MRPVPTNGEEAIPALVRGRMAAFHVPYPAAAFARTGDSRIDDPNAGGKGRARSSTPGQARPISGASLRPPDSRAEKNGRRAISGPRGRLAEPEQAPRRLP